MFLKRFEIFVFVVFFVDCFGLFVFFGEQFGFVWNVFFLLLFLCLLVIYIYTRINSSLSLFLVLSLFVFEIVLKLLDW